MSRGITNNNPGNIRKVPGVTWVGQSPDQTDTAFVQFVDPTYGIRAIARILMSYSREGLNTVDQIINRWAPPNENQSTAYVSDVCGRCQVNPDAPIVVTSMLPQLISAIIFHENGSNPYTPQQIDSGISLA